MAETMTKENIGAKIREIIGGSKMASLATICEGKPWVRYVMTKLVDDTLNLYAVTFAASRKVNQIKKDSNIHLTLGINLDKPPMMYVQYSGKAEILTDRDTRHKIWDDGYKAYFSGPDDPNLAIIKCTPDTIEAYGVIENSMESLVWKA